MTGNGWRQPTLIIAILAACQAVAAVDESPKPPFVYTNWQTFTTQDGLPSNGIRVVHVFDQQVLVGTNGGLAVYEGGRWKAWTQSDGLPWPVVTAIDVDPVTEDVWLGTLGGGLVRFTAGRFDQFDQINSGLAGDLVFAVLVDGQRVWAATNAGISLFDPVNDEWFLHLARRADSPEHVATGLAKTGEALYAYLWCGPVQRLNPASGKWTQIASSTGQMGHSSTQHVNPLDELTLQADLTDGFLWRATPVSLFRRDTGGAWESRRFAQPAIGEHLIYCLTARQGGGEAWVGTDSGVRVLADWASDSWVTYRRCDDSSNCVVNVLRHGKILDTQLLDSAIPDNRVRCITFGGDDVWVGTSNGRALGRGGDRRGGLKAKASTSTTEVSCADAGGSADSGSPPPVGDSARSPAAQSVVIGALGPTSRVMSLPGMPSYRTPPTNRPDLRAVQNAVKEFNANGGYRGELQFDSLTEPEGFFRYGWTTPEDDYVHYARQDELMGLVGKLDPSSRIASAAVLYAGIPVINLSSEPPTVDESINPWFFRCEGPRPQQLQLALGHMLDAVGGGRVAVLRTTDAIGVLPLDWLTAYLRSRKRSDVKLAVDLTCAPDDLGEALRKIQDAGADLVLIWRDAVGSAAILREMRKAGMTQTLLGSPLMVNPEFIKLAGSTPGEVVALCPSRAHEHREVARFAKRFKPQQSKLLPVRDAYLAYRATRHLLKAINVAGCDRRAVRRELERMSRDPDGEDGCAESSQLEAVLARLEEGNWRFELVRAP